MVGEFVFLRDISYFCQWTNTLLVVVTCIPFVLIALLHKLIPQRRGELFKIKWKEDYFERGLRDINQPEEDFQKRNRVEEGEKGILTPRIEDREQADVKKQAV